MDVPTTSLTFHQVEMMTVKELKDQLRSRNIRVFSRMNRDQMKDLLLENLFNPTPTATVAAVPPPSNQTISQ
jgi:hypothetical protein